MTRPACDGTWIVLVGSPTDPGEVQRVLDAYSGAVYMDNTATDCTSITKASESGAPLFTVYLAQHFGSKEAACANRPELAPGFPSNQTPYVKQLSNEVGAKDAEYFRCS